VTESPSEDPVADIDQTALRRRALVSLWLGVLAFVPGIGLAFVFVLFWFGALVAAGVGLYLGSSALRQTVRPARTWTVAVVGTVMCGIDAFLLLTLFVVALTQR